MDDFINWKDEFKQVDLLDWEEWEGFAPRTHISLPGIMPLRCPSGVRQNDDVHADVMGQEPYDKTGVNVLVFSERNVVENIKVNGQPFGKRSSAGLNPIRDTELQYLRHIVIEEFDVLCAYIPVGYDWNAEAGSGWQFWFKDVIPKTKVYIDGDLIDGPTLPLVAGGWCNVFGTLPDGELIIFKGSGTRENPSLLIDPAFYKISPNGKRYAAGHGYERPIVIGGTGYKVAEDEEVEGLTTYEDLLHYDAVWWDNRYLIINAGPWFEAAPYVSFVGFIDTLNADDTGSLLIDNIPGSSGGVCLDRNRNLITGIGYTDGNANTGDIYLFPKARVQSIIEDSGSALSFAEGIYLGKSLSAGHMVVDHNNDLFVGGGDYLKVLGSNPDTSVIGHLEKIPLGSTKNLEEYAGPGATEIIIIDDAQDDTATSPLCLVPRGTYQRKKEGE